MNGEDGSYTYTLNNSSENVQSLNANDTVYDTFKIAAFDDSKSTNKNLIFKIDGENERPTDITLSATSISEGASSLIVGIANTTDSDQTEGVGFKYSIVDLDGTDYGNFIINEDTAELSLNEQPDFETKSSYKVAIQSTDEFEKSYQKEFEIEVLDFSQNIIVFDSFGYETAKLSNVELFDYDAEYEAGWQSYTLDSFDQFSYLLEGDYDPENFKGFTALAKIPDNVEDKE